jgi:hypothetical protein
MLNELEMERIFSYAVALEQLGRQKNTIHCWENVVYILNSDKTVALRFESSDNLFKNPVGFYANDYDSPNFTVEGSSIVFLQKGEEFLRKKKCRIPNQTFQEVEDLFYKFYNGKDTPWKISFHKESLDLLNPDLSHVEFMAKNGAINILQRDIYAGTIIKLERKLIPEGLGIVEAEDNLPESISPIGMRTGDFYSLFNFNDRVDIFFPEGGKFFLIEGAHNKMTGIVSGCLYDDIGTIEDLQEEKKNGREITEKRASVEEADRKDSGQVLRRRKSNNI